MAKKKRPKRVVKRGVNEFISGYKRCRNDEQSEAALVYAVKSFNDYFSEGIIVAKVKSGRYKVVTFGAGLVKDHFHPVMWHSIRAAYEALKDGPGDADVFES